MSLQPGAGPHAYRLILGHGQQPQSYVNQRGHEDIGRTLGVQAPSAVSGLTGAELLQKSSPPLGWDLLANHICNQNVLGSDDRAPDYLTNHAAFRALKRDQIIKPQPQRL